MAWEIHFKGGDTHDKDDGLAKNAHDVAIRDKANALYNDIQRLYGNTVTKAVVETTSTAKSDFVPADPAADSDDDGA